MMGQKAIYVGYDCPKTYVFRLFLKLSLDFSGQTSGSILFQILGPAELKVPSFARLVLHLADCKLPLVEDLREQLWVALGRRSIRYCGDVPTLHWCTRQAIL